MGSSDVAWYAPAALVLNRPGAIQCVSVSGDAARRTSDPLRSQKTGAL